MSVTPQQKERLGALARELRRVAAPVGSLHSFYDVISDLECFMEGRPTILKKSAEEWESFAESCLSNERPTHSSVKDTGAEHG